MITARIHGAGSRRYVKENWSLPDFYQQCRYWRDWPPIDVMIAVKFKMGRGHKGKEKIGTLRDFLQQAGLDAKKPDAVFHVPAPT